MRCADFGVVTRKLCLKTLLIGLISPIGLFPRWRDGLLRIPPQWDCLGFTRQNSDYQSQGLIVKTFIKNIFTTEHTESSEEKKRFRTLGPVQIKSGFERQLAYPQILEKNHYPFNDR